MTLSNDIIKTLYMKHFMRITTTNVWKLKMYLTRVVSIFIWSVSAIPTYNVPSL